MMITQTFSIRFSPAQFTQLLRWRHQAVTVENSSIRRFDGTADTDSTTPTLTLTIASNLVTGEVGTATGIALGNIKGTVKSNIVERTFYGIEVFHATMTVTSNTVTGDGGSGAPFLIDRDGSTLMGNKIDAAGATGAIFGDAGTSIFKSNAVFIFLFRFQAVAVLSRPRVGTR
jgi:hypothetical protein